ncbi:hypothetical protein NJF44_01130 [Pseudomonas guariconensis]|uniref:hypothetical protein n=1 Tax=Pseudomonas TaxID=286 RepID=UPI002096E7D0|nr:MULTISPECIES: hypothetical protein [Pseudomonas]MCO7513754.1 hypothetical protein [Pseudomonas putida]MCO7603845.1 hypothetical protein [Pseudomonas guariconensis]
MPKENRSSNTDMICVLRSQLSSFIEHSVASHRSPAWVKDKAGLLAALAQPAEQHQGDAIGTLVRDYNERIVFTPIGDPHIIDDMKVYAHADPGEVERLRDELPEFARMVIAKLQRFRDCAEDGQGADIGRRWFDVLVQLGLLHRVQRSPALWEITCEGDALLESRAALERKPSTSDDLAAFNAAFQKAMETGWDDPIDLALQLWNARGGLERKPALDPKMIGIIHTPPAEYDEP